MYRYLAVFGQIVVNGSNGVVEHAFLLTPTT
jgi:hypothetical protein